MAGTVANLSLRSKAVLAAAHSYAVTAARLAIFYQIPSCQWSDNYRRLYELAYSEMQEAKHRLLKIAQKL